MAVNILVGCQPPPRGVTDWFFESGWVVLGPGGGFGGAEEKLTGAAGAGKFFGGFEWKVAWVWAAHPPPGG